MNLGIVQDSWMEIGTDNKQVLLQKYVKEKKRSRLGRSQWEKRELVGLEPINLEIKLH